MAPGESFMVAGFMPPSDPHSATVRCIGIGASMTPETNPVKTVRRYDITGRRDRAHRAQAHVLAVARELFLRDGYAATTVAGVAAAAGVSVETIYKTFRGKPGL